MARNDQLTRVLKILHYLEVTPRGLSLAEITARLKHDLIKTSQRTVRRDLEAIEAVRIGLTKDSTNDEVRWKFQSVASITDKIHFSIPEILALFLARESLASLKSSPLFLPINQLFERLEKALGIGAQKELQSLSKYLEVKPQATWQAGISQEIFDTIHSACAERSVLSLTYKAKSGEHKDQVHTRLVGPESLYFADNAAYLIAFDLEKLEHRTYAISRVIEATMTEKDYVSQNFEIKNFIKDNFGILSMGAMEEVEVFIADPIAAYVSERRWHDSQTVTRIEGGINLRMKVKTNSELVRWILGLGPAARVLSPPNLVEMTAKTAIEIAEIYGKKAA